MEKVRHYANRFPVLVLVFLCLYCSDTKKNIDAPRTPIDNKDGGIQPFIKDIEVVSDYSLAWHDEFEGTEIDQTKWTVENTDGCPGLCGFGNNELQFYSSRSDNVYLAGGFLVIKVQREPESDRDRFRNREYTSGKLITRDKGDWKYGIFEIRARLPRTQGLWPAIWMLPKENKYGGWPYSGEIDIMEMLGHNDRLLHGTLHYYDHRLSQRENSSCGQSTCPGVTYKLPNNMPSFSEDFYVFTILRTSKWIVWYVNDIEYYFIKPDAIQAESRTGQVLPGFAPFDENFYMILNVAIGGNFSGRPDSTTKLPQYMHVDYVRIFQNT